MIVTLATSLVQLTAGFTSLVKKKVFCEIKLRIHLFTANES